MKSSTRPSRTSSEISNDELTMEIEERLAPATYKFNMDVDVMASELIKALSLTGEISEKAHSAFLDSLMLSTVELYDRYQEILTEYGTPLSEYDLEVKRQAMMNVVIDSVNRLIERVHENDLIRVE